MITSLQTLNYLVCSNFQGTVGQKKQRRGFTKHLYVRVLVNKTPWYATSLPERLLG